MTLKEIAQALSVSPSTVSRVLNGRADCASAELRDKIFALAHKAGYAPNTTARALRTGEGSVRAAQGVVVALARIRTLNDDPFFLELFQALESELYMQGCRLTDTVRLDTVSDLPDCDGVIVLGRCPEAQLNSLRSKKRSIVGLWRNPLHFEVDEVVCDGQKAATMAVQYLEKLGHKKIAYIGDCSYESRYVGYCETLIRDGLPLDYSLILPTDQSLEAGQQAMEQLLERPGATSVLCANDATAIGALKALKGKKKRPISVVSIDDIDEAQLTNPLLTTVSIPRADMAHMAVLMLNDRMRGGHSGCIRVELPCRLVERESCFPCP